MKGFFYPEQPLVLVAAKTDGPPGALVAPTARKRSWPTITAATCA